MSSPLYSIDKSMPVMVTGATGYVAGVLIRQLLDGGLKVHATVRDPAQKERLQYLQDVADASAGSIHFFPGNLLEEGSFEEAMKGCSIVFHTASPFQLSVQDPQKDLVEPAVKGTENVLRTVSRVPSVRRVVLTSSIAAVRGDASDGNGRILTEQDWNRTSTLTNGAYSLSKTLAEQKAWEMAGSQTQYKLVVINPGFVLGPGLVYHESSESFRFMKLLGGGSFQHSGAPNLPFAVVDVRDVAAAHVAAAFVEQASGRHICVGHNMFMPELGDALREKYGADYPLPPTRPLPLPKLVLWLIAPFISTMTRTYVWNNLNVTATLDGSKASRELGISYRPLQHSCCDMFQQMIDCGVFEKKVQ